MEVLSTFQDNSVKDIKLDWSLQTFFNFGSTGVLVVIFKYNVLFRFLNLYFCRGICKIILKALDSMLKYLFVKKVLTQTERLLPALRSGTEREYNTRTGNLTDHPRHLLTAGITSVIPYPLNGSLIISYLYGLEACWSCFNHFWLAVYCSVLWPVRGFTGFTLQLCLIRDCLRFWREGDHVASPVQRTIWS